MTACPILPTGADASLADALASIDCQLNAAVATGYGHLFGRAGTFATALTIVLTLYVALLALGLITGRARLSLTEAMPRVLALGLVLTFATAWPAYQTVVFDLLSRGPDQIASAFLGRGQGATEIFVLRLDQVFARYLELAQTLQSQGQQAPPDLQMAARLAWAGSLLLILSTAGLLVMTRVVLAILLALGPVFIVFALFRGTRGLFEGWLKTVLAFALAPLLIVLGGAGVIGLISPWLDDAMRDPLAAGQALRPVAVLFLAALIYACTLAALLWAAVSLTRSWRWAHRSRFAPAATESVRNRDTRSTPERAPPSMHTTGERAAVADAGARLSAVFTALNREHAAMQPSRPLPVSATAPGMGRHDGDGPARRGEPWLQRWGQHRGNRTSAASGATRGRTSQ